MLNIENEFILLTVFLILYSVPAAIIYTLVDKLFDVEVVGSAKGILAHNIIRVTGGGIMGVIIGAIIFEA